MAVKLEWNAEAFAKDAAAAVGMGLDAGAIVLTSAIQQRISRGGMSASRKAQGQIVKAQALLRSLGGVSAVQFKASKAAAIWHKKARRNTSVFNRAFDVDQRSAGMFVDPPGGSPRVRTGNLLRSIGFEVASPTVRKVGAMGTAPYAGIHEFGGVINHPGGTAYVFIMGRPVFLSNKAKGTHRARTKPHTIKIPARPYIRPTASDPRVRAEIAKQFRDKTRGALVGKGWIE